MYYHPPPQFVKKFPQSMAADITTKEPNSIISYLLVVIVWRGASYWNALQLLFILLLKYNGIIKKKMLLGFIKASW